MRSRLTRCSRKYTETCRAGRTRRPNCRKIPKHSVLIIADPTQTPASAEQTALLQFLKKGGRILFTGPAAGVFFADAIATPSEESLEPETFEADVPSGFTRGAPKISMRPEAEWLELNDSQFPLYGDTSKPVVLSWRTGKGTIAMVGRTHAANKRRPFA